MIKCKSASFAPTLAFVSAFALFAPLTASAAPDAAPDAAAATGAGTANPEASTPDSARPDNANANQAKPDAEAATPGTAAPAPAKNAASPQAPLTPMEAMREDQEAFFAASLAALHAGLQLDASQESLWPPVESAIRNLAKTEWAPGDRRAAMQVRPDNARDLLRRRGERLVHRGEAIEALADAASPLVLSLKAQQRRRLPLLLEGLHSPRIMMTAFAISPAERADSERERREGMGRFRHHSDRERQSANDEDQGRDRYEPSPGDRGMQEAPEVRSGGQDADDDDS